MNTNKKLRRSKKYRKIAGVASGFAEFLEVDVIITRLIFALLALPGGMPGIPIYIICWIIIPEKE